MERMLLSRLSVFFLALACIFAAPDRGILHRKEIGSWIPQASASARQFGESDLEAQNTRQFLLERAYQREMSASLGRDRKKVLDRVDQLMISLPRDFQVPEIRNAVNGVIRANHLDDPDFFLKGRVSNLFYYPALAMSFVGSSAFMISAGSVSYNGSMALIIRAARERKLSSSEVDRLLNDDPFDRQARQIAAEVSSIFLLDADEKGLFRESLLEEFVDQILRHKDDLNSRSGAAFSLSVDTVKVLSRIRRNGRPVIPVEVTNEARRLNESTAPKNASSSMKTPTFEEKLAFNLVSLATLTVTLENGDANLPSDAREIINRAVENGRKILKKISAFHEL